MKYCICMGKIKQVYKQMFKEQGFPENYIRVMAIPKTYTRGGFFMNLKELE